MEKSEEMALLCQEIFNCKKCNLYKSRLNTVPGEGNLNAMIMTILESPGQAEDEQGRPLVGKSGRLYNAWLKKDLGLKRADVYICNILKCRPPNNRNPEPDEVKACIPYLHRQIKIVKPEVILLLGSVALKSLFKDDFLTISQNRGIWRTYKGIPVMSTYHPAYLLRQMSEKNKNMVKSDLAQVIIKLQNLGK